MRRLRGSTDDGIVVAAAESGSDLLTVETVGNHIYFYSNVEPDRCLDLIKSIRKLDGELRAEQISRGIEDYPPTPIWLHIQSPGGDLFSGFSVSDQIQEIKSPIWSVVEGQCASAATIISMACSKRFIRPLSFMLIHQLRSVAWGIYTHTEMMDTIDLQKMAMEKMYNFYVARSNISLDEIKEMLKRDSWFDAKKCLELGLVDEIL